MLFESFCANLCCRRLSVVEVTALLSLLLSLTTSFVDFYNNPRREDLFTRSHVAAAAIDVVDAADTADVADAAEAAFAAIAADAAVAAIAKH